MSAVFTWHAAKAASNLRKHGVSFEEAVTAFGDPLARIFADEDHEKGEQRELLVGYSSAGRLLVVSFAERGGTVRVISARPATPRERRRHAQAEST